MHKVQYTGRSKILIRLCETVNALIDRGAGNVEDLADVEITNLADNQILKYNSTSEKWVNANDAGGVDEFADLEDVNLTNLQDGQVPKYNATTHKWENANESGGTTVSITPTLSSGTKIADFEIDGTAGSLYAPNGGGGGASGYEQTELFTSATPVNSGTLTLSDDISNYDVLCFEYALVGSYGSGDNSLSYKYVDANYFIEAFPNTATRETDHLIIDGYDNYYLYAKMGNADNKIDVWNVGSPNTGVLKVFGIKCGSGGGGGGSKVVDLIYENANRTIENTITLDNPYTDYDFLVFEISDIAQYSYKLQTMIVLKEQLDDAKDTGNYISFYQSSNAYLQYVVTNTMTLTKDNAAYECITKIYGVKMGGGTEVIANPEGEATDELTKIQIGDEIYEIVGGGQGGGYKSTLLWDYTTDNNNAVLYGLATATLHDEIENYDALIIEVTAISSDETDVTWKGTCQFYVDVNTLENAFVPNVINCESNANRSCKYYISGTTLQKTAQATADTNGLVRVYGLKFKGGSGGGSSYSETDLWTGSGNMFNSLSITLDDAYTNYDTLRFEYQSVRADAQTVPVHYEKYVSKETLETSDRFSISDFYLWNNVGVNVSGSFTDATHLTTYLEAYSWFSSCTLTKIVGIKYGSGSGGTDVEANPTEEPTDELNTIRIGDTVYEIAGGGSGSGYEATELWSGNPTLNTITLSDSWRNYDALYIEGMFNSNALKGNTKPRETMEEAADRNLYVGFVSFASSYIGLMPVNSDGVTLAFYGQNTNGVTRVLGLKYGSGGGGSSLPFDVVIDPNDNGINLIYEYDDGQ